jgi:hypothetical protein
MAQLLLLIGTWLAATALGMGLGSLIHWLQMGFVYHADARELLAEHGDGAAAEVERRFVLALRLHDAQGAERWRKVSLALETLSRP